jgi:hypothetical protein
MRAEDERAERLLDAQADAVALFDEVVVRGIIAVGRGEQAVSDQIRDLANEMFGKTRHWHKRIVRSGPHTLFPYQKNPPDRIIEADDIVFADFGPVFEAFERTPSSFSTTLTWTGPCGMPSKGLSTTRTKPAPPPPASWSRTASTTPSSAS